MSNSLKKSIALILAAVLLFAIPNASITAVASGTEQELELTSRFRTGRTLSKAFNKLVEILIGGILMVFPNLDWDKLEDYVESEDFKGDKNFIDSPSASTWKAGYSSKSIIPNDIEKGYPMAGFFNGAVAKSTYENDGQFFSVVALDAGDGIVLFCSVDGFGMTNTNVNILRQNMADLAEEYNIKSINITTTHTHFALDIHGLGQDIGGLLTSNLKNLISRKAEFINPLNETIYNLLLTQSLAAATEAIEAMTEGSLYFGTNDISELIKDKQNPIVFDPNVNNIKFVPNAESANEIWLVNMGVHPTSLSRDTDKVSSDYTGSIVRYAKEVAGADVAFYQGAQAALTKNCDSLNLPEGSTGFDQAVKYGEEIVNRILAIDNYTGLEPILNIAHTEVLIPVTNPLLWVVCKWQMANNRCLMTSNRIQDALAVSEIGYCELGKSLAIILMPGEVSAEIVRGGTKPASIAWNNTDWEYEPLMDLTGGRTTITFGLTNDQIGYVVPDNDYANTVAEMFADYYGDNNKHYEEFLSLGKQTASTLAEAFIGLLEEVR